MQFNPSNQPSYVLCSCLSEPLQFFFSLCSLVLYHLHMSHKHVFLCTKGCTSMLYLLSHCLTHISLYLHFSLSLSAAHTAISSLSSPHKFLCNPTTHFLLFSLPMVSCWLPYPSPLSFILLIKFSGNSIQVFHFPRKTYTE